MAQLKTGDKAPSFSLPDQDGKVRSLKGLDADYLILYFYPKDDTPGCTLEGREFTSLASEFEKSGAAIWGVSGQGTDSKRKFCAKHDLKITLLSDEDFVVSKMFGVYGQKKFMGRTFNGIKRTTFVISRDGRIAEVFADVKAAGHAEAVLDFVRGLNSSTASGGKPARSAAGRAAKAAKKR